MVSDRQWFCGDGNRRKQLLVQRATLLKTIRAYFEDEGFLEVALPAIVPSPGMDTHLAAFEVRDPQERHVGYLATSPEYQMKRLLSAGLPKIFSLHRSYRAGEEGRHHEREFTMLEWYRTDAGSDEVMVDTEALIRLCAQVLMSDRPDLIAPWQRLTIHEAFKRYADANVDDVLPDEERFFRLMVDKVEVALSTKGPVFLTDWPASMASLAKLKSPTIADRFELFINGVELCNGFSELTDAAEQRARFDADQTERKRQGLPIYPIDERFIQALQEGMPPSGGNALGVDRLLMLLTGTAEIGDVMPFPSKRL